MAINRSKVQKQADKYVAAGKIEAGIAQYQLLVQENPRDLGTLNKIGDLYARINKRGEAIKNFTKIAEIYAEDGFFLKAIAIYKKINKIDPTRLETLERLATLYAKQGLHTEARAQYLSLAKAYQKAGEPAKAMNVYRSLVDLEPRNVQHRLALAELKAKHGKPEEAAQTYVDLGQELDRQGNAKESARVYELALTTSRGDPVIAERLATALAASGQGERALSIADKILEKHPDSAAMLEVRALAMEAAGERDAAEEAARGALERDPYRPAMVLCLARLLTEQGALDEAVETFSSAMDLLMGSEKGQEAVSVLEGVLSREPAHRAALEDLYRLQTMLGNEAGTLFAGEKLVEVCLSESRFSEALAVAKRLAEIEPEATRHRERIERIEGMAMGKIRPPQAEEAEEREEEQVELVPEEEIVELPDEAAEEISVSGSEHLPAVDEPDALTADPAATAAIGGPLGTEGPELGLEDEEFIAERLTEAEVFVKYGLCDRAIEQLAAIAERFPWHLDARKRLRDLYLEEGDRARAAVEAVALGRIYLEQGDRERAEAGLSEARSIDATCPAIAELESLLGGPGEAAAAGSAVAVEPEKTALTGDVYIEEEAGEEEAPEEEEVEEEEVEEEVAVVEPPLEPVAAAAPQEETAASAMNEPAVVEEIAKPEMVAAASGEVERGEPSGEVGSAEGGEGGTPAAAFDDFDLAAELDADLFSAQEADGGDEALAALEASPEGHSLDEVVSAFKKGIEKQVDAEDFETHYNLGIAYKEMGLLEEAIGEFQFASKDSHLLPSCCSMLGLCFREKGMYSLAVKWYRKGLDALASGEDEELLNGIRYDLAEALEAMGEYRQARDLLMEIFGVNSRYRDVAARLKALEERLDG